MKDDNILKEFGFDMPNVDVPVVVSDEYDRWGDYDKDYGGNYALKQNVKPKCFRIGVNKFKTIEELLMYIDLNYGNDTNIQLDMRDDIANEVIEAMQKSFNA